MRHGSKAESLICLRRKQFVNGILLERIAAVIESSKEVVNS